MGFLVTMALVDTYHKQIKKKYKKKKQPSIF